MPKFELGEKVNRKNGTDAYAVRSVHQYDDARGVKYLVQRAEPIAGKFGSIDMVDESDLSKYVPEPKFKVGDKVRFKIGNAGELRVKTVILQDDKIAYLITNDVFQYDSIAEDRLVAAEPSKSNELYALAEALAPYLRTHAKFSLGDSSGFCNLPIVAITREVK